MDKTIIVCGELKEANKLASLLTLSDYNYNFSRYDVLTDAMPLLISDLKGIKSYKHLLIKNVSRETDLKDILKCLKLSAIITCNITNIENILNSIHLATQLIKINHYEKENFI